MSENIPQLFVSQFSTNLQLRLQQMESKLRGRVTEGNHKGSRMASPVQYLTAMQMKQPAGRFAPKNHQDPSFTRYWVMPQDKENDVLIDSFDELKTIIDPKSQYVSSVSSACGRAWDDAIIAAAFAPSTIGTDANSLTTESFDTSRFQIAANFGSSSAVGLTVSKLIEARRVFRHNHVDLESDPVTLIIGSQQEADLLNQVQIVSTEFNDRPVLVDGRVTRFLGFDIVVSERLSYSSGVRNLIAFTKSGMYLGMWKDITNRISIRNDLSGEPYDLYTSISFGATRLEQGRVLQIQVADATTGDITL